MRQSPFKLQRGYSLVELTIVIALMALIVAIALPAADGGSSYRLNLAASTLADAIRFARDEAARANAMHGVEVDPGENRLRVFRLDEAPDPNTRVFDVFNPVTKQLYAVDFDAPAYRGVTLTAPSATPTGTCASTLSVVIDSHGVVRCYEPTTTRLGAFSVELSTGPLAKAVAVDPYVARVTVQ